MRGEIVLVRAFGGKPLKRRVWSVRPGVVYITNEEQFLNMIEGRRAIKPIGFPQEDVFENVDSHSLEDELIDWSRLALWNAETTSSQLTLFGSTNRSEIGVHPGQHMPNVEVTGCKNLGSPSVIQLSMFPGQTVSQVSFIQGSKTDLDEGRAFQSSEQENREKAD